MSFVTKDLDMVIFLNGRIRIKQNCHEAVRSYIERRRALYARNCNEEQETATHKHLRHLIGIDKGRDWCGAFHRPLKLKRDLIKDASWKLAPNRYDLPSEIYEKHKGAGGAHWPKLHKHKSLVEKSAERKVRYNVQWKSKNISWLFPENARDRRASSRCMVTSSSGCYRNPAEPGPTHYLPNHHTIAARISPPVISETPNPHIFLLGSSVPQKPNILVPPHISMDPAPGRYEVRYPFCCPCNPKLKWMPQLKVFIERQKRNRFRHLPYEKIKERLYCDPEWRHVKGHGFRFLFKKSSQVVATKAKAPGKASENLRLKMFHDQRYIGIITRPTRTPISNPSGEILQLPIRIKYNTLSKRIMRKQLRSNKKIAFNSGQERWKDGYRVPPFTASQQQANKERLPLERQLLDHPTTRIPMEDIRGKLNEVPKHMLPAYMPELRKRLFKFLPLPGAKVLVTEQDTRPEVVDGKYKCGNFYSKDVVPEHYFISGIEEKRAEEERLNAEMEAMEAEQEKQKEAMQNEEAAKPAEGEAKAEEAKAEEAKAEEAKAEISAA